MNTRFSAMVGLALLTAPAVASAQQRWTLALQGGPAFPTESLGNADLNTGFGFEGTVSYRFMPHFAAYAGWDWHRFTIDNPASSFAAPGTDVEETGYAFGVRFEHPIGGERSPLVVIRAGGTLNHIEIEDESGEQIADSGHGLGWEVGAGLGFALGTRWRLVPGARYRSLSRDLTIDNATTPVTLSYVTTEVGMHFSF